LGWSSCFTAVAAPIAGEEFPKIRRFFPDLHRSPLKNLEFGEQQGGNRRNSGFPHITPTSFSYKWKKNLPTSGLYTYRKKMDKKNIRRNPIGSGIGQDRVD